MAFEIRSVPEMTPMPWSVSAQAGNIAPEDIPAVRNGLMDAREASYYMDYRELINPGAEPLVGISGANGAAVASVLLPADPTEVFCVDIKEVKANKLRDYVSKMIDLDVRETRKILPCREEENPTNFRFSCNTWHVADFKKYREALIILELKMMGIDLTGIRVESGVFGEPTLMFMWAYPGMQPKMRALTYLTGDITKPRKHPKQLKEAMRRGVDFYFEKSSQKCIDDAEAYLPGMARAARRFILMGAYESGGLRVSKKVKLTALIGKGFENVNDVNASHEAEFAKPDEWVRDLTPYWWRLEYWKRK